jgi:hypothetical protein
MTGTAREDGARAALGRLKEAEDVRDELMAALHGVGVVLPSLRVEPVSYADEKPRPLVDLGRCNLRVARALAAALRGERPE